MAFSNHFQKPDPAYLLMAIGVIGLGGAIALNPQAFSGDNPLRAKRLQAQQEGLIAQIERDRNESKIAQLQWADQEAKRRIDAGVLPLVSQADPTKAIAIVPDAPVFYGDTGTQLAPGQVVVSANGATAIIGENWKIDARSIVSTADPVYLQKIQDLMHGRTVFTPGQ